MRFRLWDFVKMLDRNQLNDQQFFNKRLLQSIIPGIYSAASD